MNEMLKIEKLCKSFGNLTILNKIDLTLDEGENFVVMGKSGIGKTVLIKCIVRLVEPDSGSIEVMGDSIFDDEKLNLIRRKIGFLFQGSALYDSMSVKENLEFPLIRTKIKKDKKAVNERVMEVLESVGLADALYKKPSELSGGMKKRIALARTLILEPKIILYDEPTTGLDPITSGEISELILKVQEKYKASSIIITHDINCAEIISNRVAILQDAVFYAKGSIDELKNSSEREIRAYFNT
jgi:phospholipid/cholesterol/gamma-HCH transport system ATP-binding protein